MRNYLKEGWDGTWLSGNLKERGCNRIKDDQKQKSVLATDTGMVTF